MPTKINGNRRITPQSVGLGLFDNTIIDGAGKILVSLLPASVLGAMAYQGAFNASAGYPVAPAPANKGHYYVASVAGTISGVDYEVGDWAVSNGSAFEKIDNSDKVSSVNGKTGAAVLNTDDVGEGSTNLYHTTARVNSAFDTRLAAKSTTDLAEGTNLYFTDGRSQAASVVDSLAGTETVKAPSVASVNAALTTLKAGVKGATAMSGTVDGTNKTFTLAGNYLPASLTVFAGRVVLDISEFTATVSAGTLTVVLGASVDAPITGEDVLVSGVIA